MASIPLGQALTVLAARHPDRVAIVCDDGSDVTWADLERRANRAARGFAASGVVSDDLVALVLPNAIDVYVAAIATWKLGATPMPVSERLPEAELGPILELAAPRLVVRQGDIRAYEMLGDTRADPLPPIAPRYVRALTSGGSTGRPKVIVARQEGVIDLDDPASRTDGRVQLVTSPIFHTLGFSSLSVLLGGGSLVVMGRFDPARALELIERHRVTYLAAVPTMLHRIWRLPEHQRLAHDLSSLDTVFSTAGPFPAWLKQCWIDWVGAEKILEVYGSSESYGSTVVTGHEAVRKPGTVGRPRFGPPRILDEEGRELGVGEVGLIYFERPAQPNYHYIGAQSRVRDGWETLGDMGWVDEDGYLFLSDRRVDMVVTGGENVFPAEVEAALDEHPAVRSSVVIGLPDDDLGQRLHAIVDVGRDVDGHEETSTPAVPDESALKAHLASRLARYKIPRTFEIVTEPLRSDAGKVRRSQLRDERSTPATTTAPAATTTA